MCKKLIYKIDGKEYLLIDELLRSGDSEELEKKSKKCKAIYRGIKELKRGVFSGYAILEYLVPVENIKKWQNS